MDKKPIIIIAILCVISLGLGYVYGKWRQGSGQENTGNAEGTKETPLKEPEFLKKGLVAYYPFNGNAKDESGNGNDGEANGTTLTKDRHGNAERAYNFDGIDDYITLPSSIFEEVDGFTISAWINLNSPSRCNIIISGASVGNANQLVIGTSTTQCFWISFINQDQFSFPTEESKKLSKVALFFLFVIFVLCNLRLITLIL